MDNRFVMPNGKHVGEPITRVPVGYLSWMVNSGHTFAAQAEAELRRRGTVTPSLDVSGHAIDRASLRLLKKWQKTASKDEGIHAWLVRNAEAAWRYGAPASEIEYAGIRFVFEVAGRWPVLKTVMPCKSKQRETMIAKEKR